MNNETGAVSFRDCYATWTHETLVVGNDAIERRWRLTSNGAIPVSLFDKGLGYQWQAVDEPDGAVSVAADVKVTAVDGHASIVSSASLNVTVEFDGQNSASLLIQVFPKLASIVVEHVGALGSTADSATNESHSLATGIESSAVPNRNESFGDIAETFAFAGTHLRLKHVRFAAQTDIHNELVFEDEYRLHQSEVDLALCGNLFAFEDVITHAGLVFVKLAPLPPERPVADSADLRLKRGRQLTLCGTRYRWVTAVYHGGKHGLTDAVQRFQLALREVVPGRDAQFLSNTWGDRGQDSRINEAFVTREIAAARRLGVDVVQLDDGWQAGRTANSAVAKGGIWEGFNSQQGFWDVDPVRFPSGFSALEQVAKDGQVRLGLWFAPDSDDDFAHWRTDADKLLDVHRKHSVDYFKLDGIKMRTIAGEANLKLFMEAVRTESGGRITCDLDVTAETRPGYFGAIEAGPVFVENRYTDWQSYWPHATLRNVWKLSRYMPPVRLRVELLNNSRNSHVYGDDPLAPASYSPAYLFATAMIASPLGWFEISELPATYVESVGQLAAIWKQHRDRLHAATVTPIGDAPDGTSWTGFVARPHDGGDAYLLAFRELNDRALIGFDLRGIVSFDSVHLLAGQGTVFDLGGRVGVNLPEPRSFVFARLSRTP
ncbi:MAG TPA: alpha-galactosidase [Capsulimonadaceae bacterium]|jgi:alpha-galactosidase